MSLRSLTFTWIATAVVLGALVSAHGQQRSPRRSQPIQFSEPRQNTTASNLNEIATPRETNENFRKEIRKPSDISNEGDAGADITLPTLQQLPHPNLSGKRLKELLDKGREKRRDRGFETQEDLVLGLTAEIFKIPDFDLDGQEKKSTTKMERYYQQLERDQLGGTNQASSHDLLSRQKQNDGRDEATFFGTEKPPGAGANLSLPSLRPLFGVDSGTGLYPDMNRSGSFSDGFGSATLESPDVTRARETRLQNFKQLLDAGPLTPLPASRVGSSPLSAPAASPGFTPPRGLDSLPGAPLRDSVGLPSVGAPLGLPGDRQNLAPPPPSRVTPPPPTFALPKRQF